MFVDGTLPFGQRSAPLLFTALGDAIKWIAKSRGAGWLRHYIDDFVTVGAAGTGKCAHTMLKFKETCSMLGMLLDEKKEEGLTEVQTFLGMELNSRRGEFRLPEACLKDLKRKLQEWRGMNSWTCSQ